MRWEKDYPNGNKHVIHKITIMLHPLKAMQFEQYIHYMSFFCYHGRHIDASSLSFGDSGGVFIRVDESFTLSGVAFCERPPSRYIFIWLAASIRTTSNCCDTPRAGTRWGMIACAFGDCTGRPFDGGSGRFAAYCWCKWAGAGAVFRSICVIQVLRWFTILLDVPWSIPPKKLDTSAAQWRKPALNFSA